MLPICKIERYSTHDGEGVRTVVFTKGCPLSCFWCHNPETANQARLFLYVPQKCMFCCECSRVCPNKVHVISQQQHTIDPSLCINCGKCIESCPTNALQKVYSFMNEDDIIKEVLKDTVFYGESGGLTISGGEPLMHGEKIISLLKKAKEHSLNTAIETSGYFSSELIPELSKVVDTVLFDIKDTDAQRHLHNTGVSNETILKNLFGLDHLGVSTTLRCILLKNVNDTNDHFDSISKIYHSLKNCDGVCVFSVHPYGQSKYEQLGLHYESVMEHIVSDKELMEAKKALRNNGVVILET